MRQVPYICVGGSYLHGDDPLLTDYYRAACRHPALYEDLHAFGAGAQFLGLHIDRLKEGMAILSLEDPPGFHEPYVGELIKGLLIRNRMFSGATVRMVILSLTAEEKVAAGKRTSFLLESSLLDHDNYQLNARGLSVDLYETVTLRADPLSPLRCARSHLYGLAEQYAADNHVDTCIMLNSQRKLAETPHANLFLVKDNALFTPDAGQGCASGVMRHVVIQIAIEAGFRMNDQCSLSPSALEEADEAFLAHDIRGIQWIGAFRKKRYFKKISQELNRRLNILAFGRSQG